VVDVSGDDSDLFMGYSLDFFLERWLHFDLINFDNSIPFCSNSFFMFLFQFL
jgi:hypothetical protein